LQCVLLTSYYDAYTLSLSVMLLRRYDAERDTFEVMTVAFCVYRVRQCVSYDKLMQNIAFACVKLCLLLLRYDTPTVAFQVVYTS